MMPENIFEEVQKILPEFKANMEKEQAEKTEETDVQPADEAVEAVSEETADE